MLFYRILSIIAFPFLALYLLLRVYKKKEDPKRLQERFGKTTKERPQGAIIWLHAVSVGETNSVLVLVDELLKKYPQSSILFTTTTLTSAATLQAKLSEFSGRVIHQFLPIDSLICVKNFLNYWQPEKVIFVESEIWPNLIRSSSNMGAKVFLVNARISKRSAKRWAIAQKFGFNIFSYFTTVFVQSAEDKKYFIDLGAKEVLFCGNLKSQARDLKCDALELQKLQQQIGARKFWIAASTHKGEEEFVIQAHRELQRIFPDILTIIVPRHPNRSNEVAALCDNLAVAKRSLSEKIAAETQIYLADTLGELGIFYRLSKFIFLGGSLLPIGGHNPFEPIKLGCTVISGRGVANNQKIFDDLEQSSAIVMIDSGTEIAPVVTKLLQDSQELEALSRNALEVISQDGEVAEKIVAKMQSA